MEDAIYIQRNGSGKVKIVGTIMNGNDTCVEIETVDSPVNGVATMPVENFGKQFKLHGFVDEKKNVNQDILKLIEAGYEFSSFWGDTVDGRSINIDLNEEEVK